MPDENTPHINMSSIRVAGIGGLGMVIVVGAMALEMPEVRGFVLLGGAGGTLLGAALIGYRRWVRPDPPHGPTLLLDTAVLDEREQAPPGSDAHVRLVQVG